VFITKFVKNLILVWKKLINFAEFEAKKLFGINSVLCLKYLSKNKIKRIKINLKVD